MTGPGVQAQGSWFLVHHQHQLKEFFFCFVISILKRHSTQSLQSALQDYIDVGVISSLTNSIN